MPTRRPRSMAAAARASTRPRTRRNGSASRTARRPSSPTRSPRARRSTTTSWSSAGVPKRGSNRPSDSSVTLELRSVSKRVGADTHIHETTLELAEEGFNILLGTTLAGKTTLMQLMAGLDRPTSGEVWFNGVNLAGVPVQKRNVAMVYQQFINYPHLTVFQNIASPLKVAGMARPEIERRVGQVAELLRLSPMLGRRPAEL